MLAHLGWCLRFQAAWPTKGAGGDKPVVHTDSAEATESLTCESQEVTHTMSQESMSQESMSQEAVSASLAAACTMIANTLTRLNDSGAPFATYGPSIIAAKLLLARSFLTFQALPLSESKRYL